MGLCQLAVNATYLRVSNFTALVSRRHWAVRGRGCSGNTALATVTCSSKVATILKCSDQGTT